MGWPGVMLTGWNRQASFLMGEPFLFPSIAAVVFGGTAILGGRGNFIGTAGGAAVLTAIGTILAGTTLPPSTRNMVIGVVLIVAVALIQRERVDGGRVLLRAIHPVHTQSRACTKWPLWTGCARSKFPTIDVRHDVKGEES